MKGFVFCLAAVGSAAVAGAANLVRGGDFTAARKDLWPLATTNGGRCELAQEEGSWNKHGRLVVDRATTNDNGYVVWNAVAVAGGDGKTVGIPVKPGRLYDFSVELRGSCGKAGVNARFWNGKDIWSKGEHAKCLGNVAIRKDWTLFKGSFKVPEGRDRAAVMLQMWASTQYPPRTLKVGDTLDFDNLIIEESSDGFDALTGKGGSVEPVAPVKALAAGTEFSDFLPFRAKKGTAPRTTAKASVRPGDDGFLVAFQLDDADGFDSGNAKSAWSGDVIEVFFGPVADNVDRPFTQIAWNPSGAKFTCISKGTGSDGWQIVRSEVKDGKWRGLVKVPYAFLGWRRAIQRGEGVDFNLAVTRKRTGEMLAWAPVRESFGEIERFGRLYAGSYADAFRFYHPDEKDAPAERAAFETRVAALKTAAKQAEYDRLANRAFTVAPIPVDSDFSVPFVPRAAFHPPTNIVVKGAVNERIGVPVALLNLTDRAEEYVVRLETDTADPDPAKAYAEKQHNGTWGLKGFPEAKLTARVAVRMKDTDAEPVTLRLEQLPKMNEACTVVVPPKEAGVVWFDFDATDVKPGTYRGRLRVIPLGQASKWAPFRGVAYHQRTYSGKMQDIPFDLVIRPIVLSREPARPAGFFQSADSDSQFDLMYDVGARDFMISPWDFRWARTPDGKHYDYSKPDALLEKVKKSVLETQARMARRGGRATYLIGFNTFVVFRGTNGFKNDLEGALRLWPEYLAGVKRCMNEWGVADSDYSIEVYDEPDPKGFEEICRVHRAAKAAVPGVKLLLTLGAHIMSAPEMRTLDPVIDGWILWRHGYFSRPEHLAYVAEALAAGKRVWHYTCNTSGRTPIYETYRLHDWFGWRHGLSGNQFYIFQEQTGGYGPADFKVAMSSGIVYKSFETTMPSLRYMSMRRGEEDIKYLDLLQKTAGDKPDVKKFLAEAPVRVVETERHDPTTSDRMREQAAELILKYAK